MTDTIQIRRAYKYRMYRNDKADVALFAQIDIAGLIWNHALALQKRYYKLTGKYISCAVMKAHITKLYNRSARYALWKQLGSQARQDVLERLDKAYQAFFEKRSKLPTFKKITKYKSFTLKETAGWKLLKWNQNKQKANGKYKTARGTIRIGELVYKFIQHRPLAGDIKTVTVKRDSLERLYLCFSVLETIPKIKTSTDHLGGFDFGLKTFLVDQDGKAYMHPQFFKANLKRIAILNRAILRKVVGSHNQIKTKWFLARTHQRIADKRRDFHFKLAHALCDSYDVLIFEDLDLRGMKKRWGRKVSDLGFAAFIKILEHVATKRGKTVLFIDRFERTTCRCSHCKNDQELGLRDRVFHCERCGLVLDRDHNAAINILNVGASTLTTSGIVSLSLDSSSS